VSKPQASLPLSLAPRGLSRPIAAKYIGVSPSFFDGLVEDGRMPKPKVMNSRMVFDRFEIDDYFAALPSKDGESINEWDEGSTS
jgi:predicted DNA-binding transcriptional regulator AlpA